MAAIHDLVHSSSGSEMANLGSRQAAFLIDEITREKATFTERELFYELAWHFGASQSDLANLHAEDIDWPFSTRTARLELKRLYPNP